jgi:hypothetical protein
VDVELLIPHQGLQLFITHEAPSIGLLTAISVSALVRVMSIQSAFLSTWDAECTLTLGLTLPLG